MTDTDALKERLYDAAEEANPVDSYDIVRAVLPVIAAEVQEALDARDQAEARIKAVRDLVDQHEADDRLFWQMNGKPDALPGGISGDRIRRALEG